MPTRESDPSRDKAVGSGARGPADGGADGVSPGASAEPGGGEQRSAPIAVRLVLWGSGAVLALVVVVAVGVGISAAVKAYGRAEERADARNRVALTHIAIMRAQQQARITRAQIQATEADAQKRLAQAVGIRRAQDEIASSLTGHYLQYEAIQAQKAVASSGRNNTLIYVPSGSNGVPLFQDPQNVNRLRPMPAR